MKVKFTFTMVTLIAVISGSLQKINAQSWNLVGNGNTTATSKLGTTNAKPLRLVTNNQIRVAIDGTTGNIAVGVNSSLTDPRYRLYVSGGTSTQGSIWGDGSTTGTGVVATGVYGLWASGSHGVYGNGINHGVWGNSDGGYGVYGVSNSNFAVVGQSNYLGVYGQGGSYGVYGQSTSGQGVDGISENDLGGYFSSTNGYGIRASTTNGGYAGVFDESVFTFGDYFKSSDKNLKKNIQDLGDAMSIINKLKPKNYEFRTDDQKFASLNLPKGTHYGLIAQDVEEVLPNLVKELPQEIGGKANNVVAPKLNDGKAPVAAAQSAKKEIMNIKGVNYEELIPILVKGMQEEDKLRQEEDKLIQEQNAKIEALTQLVKQLQSSSSLNASNNVSASLSSASLDQNIPNPLSRNTSIHYAVPSGSSRAQLVITDSNGNTVKQISLNSGGKGVVTIEASTLSAGTYSYTLIVDGKKIDTKKMVIVR